MIDLDKYIPTYTDITDWNKKPYASTGGTRAKKIYTDNNQKEYFFKGSKKLDDGTFKYQTEFWSEIVSSKIGQWLGFYLLDYNVAFDFNDAQQIGCLSKSMVEYTENKLSEGVDYLRGYDSQYNPKTSEYRYTFTFIKKVLYYFELSRYESKFIEMLIFDSIVGNSDRHQENWGFITKYNETIQEIEKEIESKKGFFSRLEPKTRKLITLFTLNKRQLDEEKNLVPKKMTLINESLIVLTEFSPIYDSGCCLGRELLDEKINKMLKDNNMLEAFINKGKAEIRISEGVKKPKHLELLKYLKTDYDKVFETTLNRINENFSLDKLTYIIHNIDKELPNEQLNFKLANNRKELMIKLIALRVDKLNKL